MANIHFDSYVCLYRLQVGALIIIIIIIIIIYYNNKDLLTVFLHGGSTSVFFVSGLMQQFLDELVTCHYCTTSFIFDLLMFAAVS